MKRRFIPRRHRAGLSIPPAPEDRDCVRLNTALLKLELLRRAENVCRYLLPRGARIGNEWHCGNLRGQPGRSLSINLVTGVWADFSTSERGSNLLELWRQVRSSDFAAAVREVSNFSGLLTSDPAGHADDSARKRAQWPFFATGSRHDLVAVANLRGIAVEGVEIASNRGFLRFADWRGRPCWIITDRRRTNAQARRLDGRSFIVNGESRKAITLPGSRAGAPIGLEEARDFSAVAVVEGGPDLLAAHGYIWAEDREDVSVVAMLGASHRPSAATWSALKGKTVRVYCHRDKAGMEAGKKWGETIDAAGAEKIDGFKFNGLRKTDGFPVDDLNDLLALHPDDFDARRDVWEILP